METRKGILISEMTDEEASKFGDVLVSVFKAVFFLILALGTAVAWAMVATETPYHHWFRWVGEAIPLTFILLFFVELKRARKTVERYSSNDLKTP